VSSERLRLVVIPSDPLADYERAGYGSWLAAYFNPAGMFAEVYAVSPREQGERLAHGMTILGVPARRVRAVLATLQPDVIRAYGGGWAAELACRSRAAGAPLVVSVHTTDPNGVRRSVRYADLVIAVSRAVARCAESVGTEPAKIRTVPNRVDLDVFRPVTDPARRALVARRFPAGQPILHVGRKTEQKNLDTLIRALRHLPADYFAVFVGAGDAAPYRALAEREGVGARCFWVEPVPNEELPAWYSWCACMCTPSRWEGFGIVFIEAAACGAPIVTADIPPMNEYLVHDESACLVRALEDPAALAAALRRTCEDSPYRAALSRGARTVATRFDRPVVDRAEAAVYREALALRRASRGLSLTARLDLALWDAWGKTARLRRAVARV
jgi:glycosyltransferase involved in cell wall biosynthesis